MGARFLTRDPLKAITREAYAYAGNNPINFIDPNGLNKCEIGANPLRWGGNAQDCASDAAHAVAETDVGSFDYGTTLAGATHIGWGGWKVSTGSTMFVGGVVGTGVVGPLGIPAVIFGGWQLASGSYHIGRGFGMLAVGITRRVDCEEDQTIGANVGRFVRGVLPDPNAGALGWVLGL